MQTKRSKREKGWGEAKKIPEIYCLRAEENDQMVSDEFLKHCGTIAFKKPK